MLAFHSDHFTLALPAGHTFPMSKYRLLRTAVGRQLLGVRVHEAAPASDGELALVHDPAYVGAVAEGHLSAAQQREIGFPVVVAHGRARAPFGRRDHRCGACGLGRRRGARTWRAAPTMPSPIADRATACSTMSRWPRG